MCQQKLDNNDRNGRRCTSNALYYQKNSSKIFSLMCISLKIIIHKTTNCNSGKSLFTFKHIKNLKNLVIGKRLNVLAVMSNQIIIYLTMAFGFDNLIGHFSNIKVCTQKINDKIH